MPSTNAFRMGVCFDFQLLDALPHEEWDVRVREVITN
ncbi:MAG: hypothetical protein LBS94_03770 [Prevotellaceae bacterium]|nr:hypothetical protein [Prevotellaceae bacterium]